MNEKDINDIPESSSDSDSRSSENGHSNENLTQLHESFTHMSLSEERINSCDDHISQPCSAEREHLSESVASYEEFSCTSLPDERKKSRSNCFEHVTNSHSSGTDICRQIKPTRRSGCESAKLRDLSHRETTRNSAARQYTPAKIPAPYYSSAFELYYPSTYAPFYQGESVPICHPSHLQCFSFAGPCYHSFTSRCCHVLAENSCNSFIESCCVSACCRSSVGPCYLAAERALSYQATTIPSYQTAFVPRNRTVIFQRPRKISVSRSQASWRPESNINPRRGVESFPTRRRGQYNLQRGNGQLTNYRVTRAMSENLEMAESSQNLVHVTPLKPINDKLEPLQCNRQQLRITENNHINSSNSNSVERSQIFVASDNSRDYIALNNNESSYRCKASKEDFIVLSEASGSSIKEEDSVSLESKRNVSRTSDSNSCDYTLFLNSKSDTSKFSDGKEDLIRNSEPANNKSIKISNSEFSDENINSEEANSVIVTDVYPQAQESLPQQNRGHSRETSDSSFEILRRGMEDTGRNLNEFIQSWKSVNIDDHVTECDVSKSVSYLDSACETSASFATETGSVDPFFKSRIIANEWHRYCERQSIASNSLDRHEQLEQYTNLARPIYTVQEFCKKLVSKCSKVSIEISKLLKKSQFASIQEPEDPTGIDNISIQIQSLEGTVKQLRKWCDEYYDDFKNIISKGFISSDLHQYWTFWIKRHEASFQLLDDLAKFCLLMYSRLNLKSFY